ncbi:HupE/UreJ family protein [Thalassolituus sp. LLYu03]|uniref:HupE/UreJ family protein n=1 Tax=Thalassolituus sp. LLYu03 TaxID=3421656 RepID=UPI003D2D7FE7
MRWSGLLVLLLCLRVYAHEASYSTLYVDVRSDRVDLELLLPLEPLSLALTGGERTDAAAHMAPSELEAYVRQHLSLARGGHALPLTWAAAQRAEDEQAGIAVPVQRVWLSAPLAAASEASEAAGLQLHADLIVHQMVSHRVHVILRSHFAGGQTGAENLGIIRLKRYDLSIASGSVWTGMQALFALGLQHILDGTDHLLFLLCLLLPLPLMRTAQGTLLHRPGVPRLVVRRITAFTLAHSLTLLLAVLGWLPAGGVWVEVLVALTVLVAALQALRLSLGSAASARLAAGFGLIHGLAFAEVFAGMGLSGRELFLALLAFTLGIEVMQLALVVLVMPLLMLLARSLRLYTGVRVCASLAAALLALAWLVQRLADANGLAIPLLFSDLLLWLLVCILALGLLVFFAVMLRLSWPWRALHYASSSPNAGQ